MARAANGVDGSNTEAAERAHKIEVDGLWADFVPSLTTDEKEKIMDGNSRVRAIRVEALKLSIAVAKENNDQMQSIQTKITGMVTGHLGSPTTIRTETKENRRSIRQTTFIDGKIDGIGYTLIIDTSKSKAENYYTTLSINKPDSISGPDFVIPIYDPSHTNLIPWLLSGSKEIPPSELELITASLTKEWLPVIICINKQSSWAHTMKTTYNRTRGEWYKLNVISTRMLSSTRIIIVGTLPHTDTTDSLFTVQLGVGGQKDTFDFSRMEARIKALYSIHIATLRAQYEEQHQRIVKFAENDGN